MHPCCLPKIFHKVTVYASVWLIVFCPSYHFDPFPDQTHECYERSSGGSRRGQAPGRRGCCSTPWKLWSAPLQHPWWEVVGGFFFFFFLLVSSAQHPHSTPGWRRGPFFFSSSFFACQLSSAPPIKKLKNRSQGPGRECNRRAPPLNLLIN